MGFLVVSAVLVVLLGRLGDIYGRVRMYNLGFLVFAAASVALSLDPLDQGAGAMWLIVGRVVQGVGGAMLFANSTAILTDAFPAHQRGMALGINNVAAVAGSFLGLVIGGLLAEWDWRAVFWVSVPIGDPRHGLGLPVAARHGRPPQVEDRLVGQPHVRGRADRAPGRRSPTGSSPTATTPTGWTNPWVLAGLVGGVALLVAFVVIENRVAEPMFSMHLFRIRPFAAGNLAGLLAADRPRRHAVHADHLAAGHLAPAARLRLRVDAAVGRHLPAAADRRLPRRRTDRGAALRPVRRPAVRHRRAGAGRRDLHRVPADPGRLRLLAVRPPAAPQRHRRRACSRRRTPPRS